MESYNSICCTVFVPPYWTKGSPQSVEDLQSSLIDLLLRQQVDALTDSQAALVLMRLPTQSHGVVTEATVHGPWRRHAMMPQGDGDSDHGYDAYGCGISSVASCTL